MAVATEVVARRYLNVSANTPISVDIPMQAPDECEVFYGIAALKATLNTDYTLVLGGDFQTFTLTPTTALLNKINALIVADGNETNYITVRRTLDYTTEATAAAVRYTPFTATEFERTVFRFQQIEERLNRALTLTPNFVGDTPLVQLGEITPDGVLVWNEDGTKIITGPSLTASLTLAEKWAENPVDVPVQPGKFSAKHYAAKTNADRIAVAADRLDAYNSATLAAMKRDEALAIAEATGNVTFFDTKALADAGVGSVPANGIVEVLADESRYGASTRYRKESGSLVFKVIVRYQQPELPIDLFGNPDVDYDAALSAAIDAADALNAIITHRPGKTYYSRTGVSKTDKNVRIKWNGARILRASDASNVPVLDLKYSFSSIYPVQSRSSSSIFAGYGVQVLTTTANFAEGETVTIAGRTYTFTATVNAANKVLIGASAQASLANLVAAIGAGAGAGTAYGTGTAVHDRVYARAKGTTQMFCTAKKIAISSSFFNTGSTAANATWAQGTSSTNTTRILLSSDDMTALTPQEGDIIKIFSDDLIPWGTGITDSERLGEMIEVAAVEGNYIYAFLPLRTPMVTNVRLCKMTRREVDLGRMWFEDDEASPPTRNAPLFNITAGIEPSVYKPKCKFGLGRFLQFVSCWRNMSEEVFAKKLRTSTSDFYNSTGYGILDIGCQGSLHLAPRGSKLRHLYTTGANSVAENATTPERYGGVIDATIISGFAYNCEHAGFDTHADAFGVDFVACTAKDNYRGHAASIYNFGLRGYQVRMIACVTSGAGSVNCNAYGTGGDFDIDVHHTSPIGSASALPQFNFDGSTATVRPKARLRVRGTLDDFGVTVIQPTAFDVDIPEIDIDYAVNAASTGNIFGPENCTITVGRARIDLRRATAGNTRLAKLRSADCAVYMEDVKVSTGGGNWYVGDFSNFEGGTIIAKNIEADTAPSAVGGGFANRKTDAVDPARNSVGWCKLSVNYGRTVGPRFIPSNWTASGTKTVTWQGRGEDNLVLLIKNTATSGGNPVAISIGSLEPPVHNDQRLTVFCHEDSTAGVNFLTTTTNASIAANFTLTARQSRRFFAYNGYWQLEQ